LQSKGHFEKLKLSVDVDHVFSKGFDEKFKAKLLADIKDLMIESDWHSIDK